jgi:transketolase
MQWKNLGEWRLFMSELSTRQGFGKGIMSLASMREDIVLASADSVGGFGLESFIETFPDRYFEFGISEQNMVAACAGMASEGYKVFCLGHSPFLSMRALEQIRTFAAYPRLAVKVAAGMSGLAGEANGVSHQGTEDIAIVRSIPGLSVLCPADAVVAERIAVLAVNLGGPVYIRLGRSPTPNVYNDEIELPISGSILVRDFGDDLTIMATGPCVREAVAAADALIGHGIRCKVLDIFCIKPLDAKSVVETAAKTGVVLTVEDGCLPGGLGGAIAETLMDAGVTCVLRRLGLEGFGTGGRLSELLKHFHLDASAIIDEAEKTLHSSTRKG